MYDAVSDIKKLIWAGTAAENVKDTAEPMRREKMQVGVDKVGRMGTKALAQE